MTYGCRKCITVIQECFSVEDFDQECTQTKQSSVRGWKWDVWEDKHGLFLREKKWKKNALQRTKIYKIRNVRKCISWGEIKYLHQRQQQQKCERRKLSWGFLFLRGRE